MLKLYYIIICASHNKNKLILQYVYIHVLSHFVHTWCVVYKFYILKYKIMNITKIFNLY